MSLKGQRVVFANREHSPTGIVEEEEPDVNGDVMVYWGHHDGKSVRSAHPMGDLAPAPLLTEAPDLVPGVDPNLIIKGE